MGLVGWIPWSDASIGNTGVPNNLMPGIYTVTITGANGCSIELTKELIEPELLVANAITTPVTMLDVNDGTAAVTVTGGSGNYSYEWNNGEITPTITGLAPGNYDVIVTDLTSTCTAIDVVVVAGVTCNLSTNITATNETLFDANDGTATIIVTGG